MNEIWTLRTIFGVVLLNCVLFGASAANAMRSRGSVRYQSNPEIYEPIPVAIVYEDKNDRGAKQLPVTTTGPATTTRTVTTIRPVTTTKHLTTTTTTKRVITSEPVTMTRPTTTTQQTTQNDLSRYQYNHPPAYQPIPVAIVNDEKNNRGAKQFNDSVSNTESSHRTDSTSIDSTYKQSSTKHFKQEIDDIKVTTWRSPSTPVSVTTTTPVTTTKHHTTTMGIEITTKPGTTIKPAMTTEPVTTTKLITMTQQTMQNDFKNYQYNHPPEAYQPIPVAIVYDDKKNRGTKQFTDLVSSTETTLKTNIKFGDTANKESSTKHLKQEFEDITVTTWRPPNTVGRPNEIKTLNPKQFYPTADQFIPVAIVYDPESVMPKNKIDDKAFSKSNAPKQSRKQKQYTDVLGALRHTTEKVSTIISSSTSSSPEVVSVRDKIPQQNGTQYINEIRHTPSRNIDVTTEKSSTISSKPVTKNQTDKYFMNVKISTTTEAPKHASDIKKRGEKIKDISKFDKPLSSLSQESDNDRYKGGKREKDPVVPILESENHVYAQSGAYYYSYEGGDGTKAYSNGVLKEFDNETTGESVSGGFSYTDGEGRGIRLTYTADENGYRPVGDHLPTPPPIPPQIARALAYLATKPTEPPEEDATEPAKKV